MVEEQTPTEGAIPSPRRELVARVQNCCLRRGWDLGDLAKAAGVSRSTLYGVVRGTTRKPHGATIRKIAAALGLSPEQLWAPANDPTPVASQREIDDSSELRDGERHRFDRITNPVVESVRREHPEFFGGWRPSEWDELYSTFGTGGKLTYEGVLEAARGITRKRTVIAQLQIVLETHLSDVAAGLVETLYDLVRPPEASTRTAERDADDAVAEEGGPTDL